MRWLFMLCIMLFSQWAASATELSFSSFLNYGKPIYGVVEFNNYYGDVRGVRVAESAQYESLGYAKAQFLDTADVRQIGPARYELRTDNAIDVNSFVLLVDVVYSAERKLIPITIIPGTSQASIRVGAGHPVSIETGVPVAPSAPVIQQLGVDDSSVINSAPRPSSVNAPRPVAAKVDEVVSVKLATDNQEKVAAATQNHFAPSYVFSPTINAPQPQLQAPQMPIVAPSPVVNDSQNFYVVMIVSVVLMIVLAAIMGMFFISSSNRQAKSSGDSEQHYALGQAVQALTSLMTTASQPQPVMATAGSASDVMEDAPPVQPVASQSKPVKKSPVAAPQDSQVNVTPPPPKAKPAEPVQPAAVKQKVEPAPMPKQADQQIKPTAPASTHSTSDQSMMNKQHAPSIPSNVDKNEKLQLAIVYLNMGDEMMARMLLDEVIREGSEQDRAEAQMILDNVNAQGVLPLVVDDDEK